MRYNDLNEDEKRVILEKGTEIAFSGKFWNHHEKGIYVCKRCSIPLFNSNDKFYSGMGWPSFDDTMNKNVKEVADEDGKRTQIICKRCDAHLGYVFKGEGFTYKRTRYCVNSMSLNFVKQ